MTTWPKKVFPDMTSFGASLLKQARKDLLQNSTLDKRMNW